MPVELERLVGDVKWAKANRFPARELKAMLRRLVEAAPEGSEERRFARLELAAMLMENDPWLAARLATDALRARSDDRAWGILGIAHTVLGNFRSALRAQRHAVELAPGSAEHEHNLGHLLDVAFRRPLSALPHLRRAHRAMPDEPEITSSLCHALVKLGRLAEAERLLAPALDGDTERARSLITAWMSDNG